MKTLIRVVVGLAALLPIRAAADDDVGLRVAVCVDVTPEGAKVALPAADRPVLYAPVAGGYREVGAILTFYQRTPPSDSRVLGQLIRALAPRGYRVAGPRGAASIVLSARWGYVAPTTAPGRHALPQPPSARSRNWITNREVVMSYIIGDKWKDLAVNARRGTLDPGTQEIFDDVRDAANENPGGTIGRGARYYLIISALDAPAFARNKAVLLWRAHVSAGYWGHYLDEVLPTLIAAATPLLGRDTPRPVVTTVAMVPWGADDKPEASQVAHYGVVNPSPHS
jgi:hypothetical protein